MLRLRPEVYYGQSLAALGRAAHEAGHALQDATGYPLLGLRNRLVPMASLGSPVFWLLIPVGCMLVAGQSLWGELVLLLGIAVFSVTVLGQLINLPIEFDASKRAQHLLVHSGMVTVAEAPGVQRVLHAAALTYVAATLTAALMRLYCCIRAGQRPSLVVRDNGIGIDGAILPKVFDLFSQAQQGLDSRRAEGWESLAVQSGTTVP